MPLNELTDEQLDRQLRELLPPAPRSRAWERTQRERLIHYITTGESGLLGDIPRMSGPDDHGELLELVPLRSDRSRPRDGWIVASAAAAVVLLFGLLVVQRPADAPAPAQQPAASPPSRQAEASPDGTVASLTSGPLAPDRFGVVTEAWPAAATASATWGGLLGWDNSTAAEALVARPDGEFLRDGVALSVHSNGSQEQFPGVPQAATVAGFDVEVYVEPGSPAITTVVLPGTPAIAASGLDPLSFLEAARGFPVYGERIDGDGEVTFAVDTLPDGYEVVVPPTRLPLGSVDASTRASDGDGGDGIAVWVAVRNPLLTEAQVGDLQEIDINGTLGWLHDRGRAASVVWQVSEATWATVGGASTVGDAVTFARSIDFVDASTWTERYDVDQPDYPTQDQMINLGTTPISTAPEATTPVVSRTKAGSASPTTAPTAPAIQPTSSPPTELSLPGFGRTDPEDRRHLALAAAVDEVLEQLGWILQGTEYTAKDEHPFFGFVTALVGDARVIFEVQTYADEYSTDPYWQMEIASSPSPGTPVVEGTLFLLDEPGIAVRRATVLAPLARVRVEVENVPTSDLPSLDTLAVAARELAARLPEVLS